MVGQTVVHGRDPEEHRALLVDQGVENRLGGKPGLENRRAADQQGSVEAESQTVHVEQRQAEQQAVVVGPPPGHDHRVGPGQQAGLGVDRPLRLARGSGGVGDQRRCVRTCLVETGCRTALEVDAGGGH